MHSKTQRDDELARFVEVLVRNNVKSFLEIGSRYGQTFRAVMGALGEGSRGVAVDMPAGKWGRDDSQPYLERCVDELTVAGRKCTLILGNSRDADTVGSVAALGPFDAVFIDGDHRYKSVRADWRNYGKLATKIVGFHDIDAWHQKRHMKVEVPKLWAEIKEAGHVTQDLIGVGRGMGIGVIYK